MDKYGKNMSTLIPPPKMKVVGYNIIKSYRFQIPTEHIELDMPGS